VHSIEIYEAWIVHVRIAVSRVPKLTKDTAHTPNKNGGTFLDAAGQWL